MAYTLKVVINKQSKQINYDKLTIATEENFIVQLAKSCFTSTMLLKEHRLKVSLLHTIVVVMHKANHVHSIGSK